MESINITQELTKTGNASYEVRMTVNDAEESEIFTFDNTNGVYPLYKSLIEIIKEYKDVTVNLTTSDSRFGKEIQGVPNRNTTLLDILKDVQERNEIEIIVTKG